MKLCNALVSGEGTPLSKQTDIFVKACIPNLTTGHFFAWVKNRYTGTLFRHSKKCPVV